mgnify:FL=1
MEAKNILILAVIIAGACNRIETVNSPEDFNVVCITEEIKAGKSVKFVLSGNPDVISFYSGEVGNDYEYTGGRIVSPEYVLTFDEQAIDGEQEKQLSILISDKQFDSPNYEDVSSNKGWKDISDRFNLLGPGKVTGNRNYTNVGYADITDLVTSDETKLSFAIRYTAKPFSPGQSTNIIRVKNFYIKSKYNETLTNLYSWPDMGWNMVTKFPQQSGRSSEIQEGNKVIQNRVGWGNKEDGSGTYQSDGADNWTISNLLSFQKILDMGPDHAIGIKGVNDVKKDCYEYSWNKPGTYNVVFVAKNVNINGCKEKVIKLTVNVQK